MAKRFGSVIVFKQGVTKEQAAKALASLAEVVEFPAKTYEYVPVEEKQARGAARKVKMVEVPFAYAHAVHDFEDEHGSPVWYIP